MHPKQIAVTDFANYLPTDKIALYPLPEGDQALLAIYKDEDTREDIYKNIA
jgi:hypothetical protein